MARGCRTWGAAGADPWRELDRDLELQDNVHLERSAGVGRGRSSDLSLISISRERGAGVG